MPYSGASDPKLPGNVKKLPDKQRRQWVQIWNSAYKRCQGKGGKDCESSAFAQANGVVMKKERTGLAYVETKDGYGGEVVASRWFPRRSQDSVNYDPLGGMTGGEACANCQWFISPNACAVVDSYPDPISPTGKSDLWLAREEPADPEPVPVIVVDHAEPDGDEGESSRKDGQPSPYGYGGYRYEAKDYAIVGDDKDPKSWKVRITEAGNYTYQQIHRAIMAIGADGPNDPLALTADEKSQAKRRITSAITDMTASDDQKTVLRDQLKAIKDKTWLGRMKDRFGLEDKPQAFKTYKDAEGRTRWVSFVTNNRRDEDNPPELFEEKAHVEFEDYLDKTHDYPELWLWHTKGTRWGECDFWAYHAGHVIASGTVDAGKEYIAERLAAVKDLKVSHGYRYSFSDKSRGIIGWYRTFEISPLPGFAAANPWTSFQTLQQEGSMKGIKLEFLTQALGADEANRIARAAEKNNALLDEAGVERKEKAGDAPPKDPATTITLGMKELEAVGAAAVKAITASDDYQALTKGVKELGDRVVALEKSDGDKIADAFKALVDRPGTKAHIPSRSNPKTEAEILAEEKAAKERGQKTPTDPHIAGNTSWFDNVMEGALTAAKGQR